MGGSFSKRSTELTSDWYQTAVKEFSINEISYKKLGGERHLLGRSGFGFVYKTNCKSIGIVAIKEFVVTYEDFKVDECIKSFIREVF